MVEIYQTHHVAIAMALSEKAGLPKKIAGEVFIDEQKSGKPAPASTS